MRDTEPISMFCGFPVIVATLPTFAAMASASRCGFGSQPRRRVIASTSGVSAMHTTSLIMNADSAPLTAVIAAARPTCEVTRFVIHRATSPKPPEISSAALITIIPKRSASVAPSIASCAFSSERPPTVTMSAPPMRAAASRSERSPGTRPIENATYENTRMATGAQTDVLNRNQARAFSERIAEPERRRALAQRHHLGERVEPARQRDEEARADLEVVLVATELILAAVLP